jgi:hypothetical protein
MSRYAASPHFLPKQNSFFEGVRSAGPGHLPEVWEPLSGPFRNATLFKNINSKVFAWKARILSLG